MMGAIIGDIAGSIYEFNNQKDKSKIGSLLKENCFFTDDTVMTIAVAEGIMNGGSNDDFVDAMKKYGRMYPDAGYGSRFAEWLRSDDRRPYNSWGNGAAMRVSPVGWLMDCGFFCRTGCWPQNAFSLAERSAAVTHDHPEGIKGAQAVTAAIFFARLYTGRWIEDYGTGPMFPTIDDCKAGIKKFIEQNFGYDLSFSLDKIRPGYQFDESCQGTVPQAIVAFLESRDFASAIRNAISLGGDSDTIAAITGSIAEAAYGIPDWLQIMAWDYLDKPLQDVCRRWARFVAR